MSRFDKPLDHALAIVPGSPVLGGRSTLIVCTVAGVLNVKVGATTIPLTLAIGSHYFDRLSVNDVVTAGSTATAAVYVLT